jgi:hypothetical protein
MTRGWLVPVFAVAALCGCVRVFEGGAGESISLPRDQGDGARRDQGDGARRDLGDGARRDAPRGERRVLERSPSLDLRAETSCPHSPCTEGGPIGESCSVYAACVCKTFPACCTKTWDNVCVGMANACGASCP